MRSRPVLTAPSFSGPGRGVSTRPGPPKRSSRCHTARRMGCEPCGRREAAICAAGPFWVPVRRFLALLCVFAARCRSTRSKCAHPHGRLPELRRRARPAPPKRESAPTAHPRPSPHAVVLLPRIASSVSVSQTQRATTHLPPHPHTPRRLKHFVGKDLTKERRESGDTRHVADVRRLIYILQLGTCTCRLSSSLLTSHAYTVDICTCARPEFLRIT